MNIRKELLDELLQECKTPPDLFGEGGILKQLTTALVERALEAELSMHLGYKKHESRPEGQSNSRNGYSQKKGNYSGWRFGKKWFPRNTCLRDSRTLTPCFLRVEI
nr:transposase [Pseudanabaena mucicola]